MKQLILIRHGLPDHVDRDMTGGWTPSNLTEVGRHQADLTGKRLKRMLAKHDFDFFSSDLPRASQTAEIIGTLLGRQAVLTPALREQRLGDADNKTNAQAAQIALNPTQGPPVDRLFFPGAETWRDMMHRIFTFLDELDQTGKEIALLVSHCGASNGVLFWWLNLESDWWPDIQFDFDLCSLTHLGIGPFGGRRVTRINDVSHLGRLHR